MGRVRVVTASTRAKGFSKLSYFLDAIKFQESVFALPFAYIGMILAGRGLPTLYQFIWITVAMVSARTVGMIANRIIDRNIDAKNPRASFRHLPAGILTVSDLAVPGLAAFFVFMVAAWMLNNLAFILAPIAAVYLVAYPYTKRFTWSANLLLGWALAIAPSAAWIGVTGSLTWQPVLLSSSVALWAGSFDIIYHCQDIEFQSREGLHSVARKFGVHTAFRIAKLLDICALICLTSLGIWMELTAPYYASCLIAGCFLGYKYKLVKPDDLTRLGMAFMRINAFVSLTMLLGTSLSVFVWK